MNDQFRALQGAQRGWAQEPVSVGDQANQRWRGKGQSRPLQIEYYWVPNDQKEEEERGTAVTLRGSFRRSRPAKRAGTRNRKTHLPEISILRDELNAHVGFSVASFPDGGYFAIDRFPAIFVHHLHSLAHHDGLFHREQAAFAAYRLRIRFH